MFGFLLQLAQQLIKYVNEEMQAYRLYTVTPQLVRCITQLTNWYVRLNRDRLKGAEGDDVDAETGLQVLYDVLLNMTTVMAPFAPFITEFFYQHLRKTQPSFAEAADGGGSSDPVQAGKSDSVHFLGVPTHDPSRLNQDAVEAMEILQTIVKLGRNVREKRLINLKTPVTNIVVVLRNPSENVVNSITGSLKGYTLSELNAWDLTIVPEVQEHEWVTLSLTPDFKKLGKKFGIKMKTVAEAIKAMSHTEAAVVALEKGSIDIEGGTVDALTEMVSKLLFSKDGEQWEYVSTHEGDYVIAVDCTQDEAILAAGRARELINAIQQLRKNAGLALTDKVEVLFSENETDPLIEAAVSGNVDVFRNKLKGAVPVPKRFASDWSVVIGCETAVEIAGSKVDVTICRPAVAANEGLSTENITFISTVSPSSVEERVEISFVVGGKDMTVKEGKDFWLSTASKLVAAPAKAVDWL